MSEQPTDPGLDYLLQHLLRGVLALDNESANKLQAVAGSSVLLQVENTGLCLLLDVAAASTTVTVRWADPGEDSDVFLSVPAPAVITWLRQPRQLPPGAKVRGDVELLREWGKLGETYSPDLEQLLADKLGDDVARTAATVVAGGYDICAAVASKLRRDIADTMMRSRQGVASPGEVNSFAVRVDELRNRLDWLQVRLRDKAGRS